MRAVLARRRLRLVLAALALVALAVALERYAQGACLDFPVGQRCSTAGQVAIAGSVASALGAVVALATLALVFVRGR